jgi:tetratricopeptide (TPR) repeat protein
LRRARQGAGLSLAQLGGQELTRQAVHLFESGRANPSARSLELLAERLRVPVESLLRSTSRQPEASPSLPDERYEHLLETNRFDEVRQFALDTLAQADAGLRLRALAHHYLGQALCHLARPDEALEHLRRARGLADAMGDPWLAAESQGWEATALYARDDPEALAVGQAALDRYRLLEPRRPETEARMLERLATVLARRRSYERALEHYERALELAGPVRDLVQLARIYHGLSHCHRARQDLRRAIELLRMAVALLSVESQFRPQAARIGLPRAENDLGHMLIEQGELGAAEESLTAALEHFSAGSEDRARGSILVTLAELRVRQGRRPEARQLLTDAVGLAERLNEPATLASALQQWAGLHEHDGEHDAADRAYGQALSVLERAGLDERCRAYERAYAEMLEAREGRRQLRARTTA